MKTSGIEIFEQYEHDLECHAKLLLDILDDEWVVDHDLYESAHKELVQVRAIQKALVEAKVSFILE